LSQINDALIRGVFDELVKFRPPLSKYLIADDESGEVDLRVLADQIIKSYPWPIGVELRRLFSGSMRLLDRLRLDQLFKTIERTMQFMSFVMVIELYEEVLRKNISLDEKFKDQFTSRFSQLSLGNFAWLIRAIGNVFRKEDLQWFMPEMNAVLTDNFYKGLDFWVPERNEIGHYQINLTQEEIEKRCVEYTDKLAAILIQIAHITKYKLVTIREIKVNKLRHRDAKYLHWMDMLNSSDSDFKSTEETLDAFSDSKAVLLMKSVKEPREFLNLSPLIIDTRTEVIDAKEKFSIKKDIFMYTKVRDTKLMYVGTEVTEHCDLTHLSNYEMLSSDFSEIMELLGLRSSIRRPA
jgi:hypothetical protein